jgi:DNA polymerase-3 subunit epsilon
VLVIAHNADFDRRFLEKRLPVFAAKHWACSRADIDWKAEGVRSSALEFVAYSLGFFHDGHRDASDCRATLHALAQPLPGTGRLALQALLEQARLPTWRLWARDAAIEKKDVLKARGYAWSPGEFGRPKCWYRDVAEADKAAEVSWLRANVMGRIKPYGHCASQPEIGIPIDAGVGANRWILRRNALPVAPEGAGAMQCDQT